MLRRGTLGAVGCGWLVWVVVLGAGCAGDPATGIDARATGGTDGGLDGGLDRAGPDVGPAEVPLEAAVPDMGPAPGFLVMPTAELETTERGGQATFTVVLLAPPSSPVTIPLSSDKPDEGTVSPAGLLFTPANWNAPQTVTVTGVDDPDVDGDTSYTVLLGPVISADGAYQGLDPGDVTLTNSDDESPGITVATAMPMPATTEAGGQATFTVVLKSRPTGMVAVPLASGDASEATVTPAAVLFTADNWSAPQTVTVTGVDDQEADGNVAYKVKVGPPTTADVHYAAVALVEVALTNTDNETAGITLTPPQSAVTTEVGGTASFQLVLNSRPTAKVTIVLASSDISEGTIAPASLSFTPDNWNAPQSVVVTGVDDTLPDGNQMFNVSSVHNFSLDPNYNDLTIPAVAFTNTDNDSAGITVNPPPAMASTSEAGRQVTFSLVLNAQPTANVIVPLSSSDASEGTVGASSLTFTPANWNAPQPVTVTGVDDDLADGNQPYTVVIGAAASSDTAYSGIDPTDVTLSNVDNDSPGITVTAAPFLTTTELAGQATFTVVLNSQPTGNVVIPLSSSDATEGTVATANLTFTPANWNAPQTVTVTGVDDALADGSQIYSVVTGVVQSADNAYQGIDPPNVLVFNTDNDSAGITVTAAALLTTTEAGGQAMFTVVLNSQPAADVTIPLTSSDVGEGTVSPASLVFTSANWSVAQMVTVTGVNDALADSAQPYSILLGNARSTDASYNGLDPADVNASNTDDDSAGITVTAAAGLTTTEAGGMATFTVRLNSEPAADVVVALSSSDTSEGTVSPAALTFTAGNWSMAQTVTITGVDDALDDGNQTFSIVTAAAASTDAGYAGLNPTDVMASNTDNDSAGLTVAAAVGLSVTEAAGMGRTASFTVVLNSEPTAAVVVALSSSDTSEGTVSPASLTFSAANWNTPQTVTVTGVDDALDDGNVGFSVVTGAAASADLLYSGVNAADVTVTAVDDDAAGISVTPVAGLTVTEASGAGNNASFAVVLTSQPTGSVSVALSSSDTTEGTVSPASLTFTTANWDMPQTVTITGVNDLNDDGDVAFSIVTAAATSTDSLYNLLNAADVAVSNLDNDTAGVSVVAAMGLASSEAAGPGNQASFTVVLTAQPTSNVSINLSSSDTTEGTVSPAVLVFTSANWNMAQAVTVTGEDDDVDDGDVAFTIVTADGFSADTAYNGLAVADVAISNTDDDTAGISITAAPGISVTEAAGASHTASFTVVLTSQPTASVVVGLSSSDTTEGTVSPASLTFTTANWNTPRTVTITGVDDDLDDGTQTFSIVTAAAVTADSVYSGMNAADVSVDTVDEDVASITVTAAPGLTVTEAAGAGNTATFTVVLTSQPLTDVVIGLTSSDTSEGTVSAGFLTFTAANWSTPQLVTITGVDDAADDGDVAFTIVTAPAQGTGSGYAGTNAADVSVTNLDDD